MAKKADVSLNLLCQEGMYALWHSLKAELILQSLSACARDQWGLCFRQLLLNSFNDDSYKAADSITNYRERSNRRRLSFPTQLIPSSTDCKSILPHFPVSHRHWVSCTYCIFLFTPPMSYLHKRASGMGNTAIVSHSFSSLLPYIQEKARFNLACLLGLFTHSLQHAESTEILNTNSFL